MVLEVVEDIEVTAKRVEALRAELLLPGVSEEGDTLSPVAEQHYMMALALLDQAQRAFMLAAYASRRGE